MRHHSDGTPSLVGAMTIFGTIGVLTRYIPFPSGFSASVRGLIGVAFLLIFCGVTGKKLHYKGLKRKLPLLILSGAMIGVNWILLFEAYRYTTVASAILCYYSAPILVILASPFLFKERISGKKMLCVLATVVGVVMVSGVASMISFDEIGAGISSLLAGTNDFAPHFRAAFASLDGGDENLLGLGCALGAAVLYAAVVCMNKAIGQVGVYEKTTVQLASAGIVILPYVFLCETMPQNVTVLHIFLIILLGVLHTGVAYALYFGALPKMRAQKAALLSYIDPIVAVLLSALVLHEPIGWTGIVGAVLILGSAVCAELADKKAKK